MNDVRVRALIQYFLEHPENVSQVVEFDKDADHLFPFDFTLANTRLTPETYADTAGFSKWIRRTISKNKCRYGIGGYGEHRVIYSRRELFDKEEEPRRLHLGVDIWGPEGTAVFSPVDGTVHSYRYNDTFGDYGATLILAHEINGVKFHSLYGHLNLAGITDKERGTTIHGGEKIAEFGHISENGHWPPHLHFQLIFDMQGMEGDYPGVCRYSERDSYLNNCPDPDMILKHTFG